MKTRFQYFGWLVVTLATIYGVALLLRPSLLCIPLSAGGTVDLWRSELWYMLRWPLVIAGALCSATLLSMRRIFRPALPFMFVPLPGIAVLLSDYLPAAVTSNAIFLAGTGFVCAVILNVGAVTFDKQGSQAKFGTRLFLISWLIYSLTGLWTVRWIGEIYGSDERAYLAEAASLWEDGDLDLHNNGEHTGKITREELHISPNSATGHWYSWHLYGLPLILAPVSHAGPKMRVIVLAIFGALANLGMYRFSLLAGATTRSSLLVVAVLGGSLYWAFYATRLFTEMLGAALLVWLFVAAWEQDRYPWKATLLAGLCGVYLALLQLRYLPAGVLGLAVFSGLAVMQRGESGRSKLCRLGALAAIVGVGYAILFVSQVAMFGPGTKGPMLLRWTLGAALNSSLPATVSIADGAFASWSGLWISLLDTMGLVSVFPLFLFMSTAAILAVFRGNMPRGLALIALCAFGTVWVTSCSNTFCVGIGSVPGRYLIIAIPMLVPATACALDRSSGNVRTWFVFLGAWSIVLLVVGSVMLPRIGKHFLLPLHGLAEAHPLLSGLFHPHARFLETDTDLARIATFVYAAGTMLVTALFLFASAGRKSLTAVAWVLGLALAVTAHAAQSGLPRYVAKPAKLANLLLDMDRNKVRMEFRNTSSESVRDLAWVHLAAVPPLVVTTRDLGAPTVDGVISEPRIAINDWAGRDIRWVTLTKPFAPRPGAYLLEIEAAAKESAGVTLVIREGTKTLYEDQLPIEDGNIRKTVDFQCQGHSGDIYILINLRGENAECRVTRLRLIPWGRSMSPR